MTMKKWFTKSIGLTSALVLVGGMAFATQTQAAFTGGGNLDLFAQCANDDGDGYTGADLGCHWTNGDLNSSNSTYHEDDATVQRLAIKDLTAGDHYAIIKYSTTKGGKHSYDFMTDDDYSELDPNPLSSADLCDPAITNLASCASLTPALSGSVPTDTNAGSKDIARTTRHFKIRNGTWVAGGNTCGQSGTDACGLGFSSGPKITSGTYAGDSDTIITVNFHVDTSGPNACEDKYQKQGTDVCEVLITWGAHVSSQADWGAGNSAVNISGSPYHVQLANIDNPATTGGGNDNQMAASAVVQTGSITIVKDAVPNDPQDFSFTTTGTGLSNFSLDDDGDNANTLSNTKVFNGLLAGSYTVTEGSTAGWALTGNLTCTDPTTNSTINLGTRTASINLAAGENITCTFVNTLQTGHLIVEKTTVPAADPTVFSITASGNGTITGGGAGTITDALDKDYEVTAGTYSVAETVPTGWSKTGDTCQNVVVAAGATVHCTITNIKLPKLTVIKVVVNDNGGTKVVSDFPLFVDVGSVTSGVQNTSTVGAHVVSETGSSDYTAAITGDCDANGNVSLAAGDVKACTITNNDNAAHLIVIKHVMNDNGGTATASSFSTTISGVSTATPTAAGTEAPGVDNVLTTVGSYSVDEGAHVGYTKTLSTDCTGTIALGQTKTCTITNDDDAPALYLRKVVVNDNGGTATLADFTLTANGAGSNDISGTSPVDSGSGLLADTFALSETNVSGYTASAWVCVGGLQSGSNITLGLGESATCTITNDDQQAYIIVDKTVVNDNGGTKVANDFLLTVDGNAVSDAVAYAVNPGTHTAGETNLPGYTAGAWGGDCNVNASVTVALGETKTCTITNNDNAPSLHLRKVVTNNNGGTAVAADFTLTANGTGSNDVSGTSPADSDATLQADTFALSESGPAGYSASSWVCVGGTQNSSSITLALGESATCTITNDDIPAHLIVIKHVINHGGSAVAGNFSTTISGVTTATPTAPGAEAPGVDNELNSIGAYTVDEGANADYTKTLSADCSGSIALGQTKTCTITNEEKTAKLTIVKDAQPNDCQDFAFAVTGQTGFSLDDDQDNTSCVDTNQPVSKSFLTLDTGSYTVTETEPNTFWTLGSATCVNTGDQSSYASNLSGTALTVLLTPGVDVTCTFVNNKVSPTRTIGFWQTHTAFTSTTFSTNFAGGMQIGSGLHKGLITNTQTTGASQLFGGFFANIAKTTTGAKRTAIEQARMQLLQQLIGAKLNCAAFTCSPAITAQIANADSVYATGTAAQIIAAAGQMGAYNNSGDTLVVPNTGSATPTVSKSIADLAFWNLP